MTKTLVMRRIVLLLLPFGAYSIVWGQGFNTPLSLISSVGGQGQATIQSQVVKVEWTIGETFIGIGNTNDQSIITGQQQGIRNDIDVSLSDLESDNVIIYPNPADHYIHLDNLPDGVTKILLYSLNGSQEEYYTPSNPKLTISTSRFPSGMYILVMYQGRRPSRTFKIAITNN